MTGKRRRDFQLCALALAVMAALAVVHVVAVDVPWLRRLELIALDMRIRLRGPLPPGPEIVIVMIDDRTIAEFGRWPVPRERVAELLERLDHAGAKAIGIDVLFAEPAPQRDAGIASARGHDEPGDSVLASVVRDSGKIVLPFTFKFRGHGADNAGASIAGAAYQHVRATEDYRAVDLNPTGLVTPIAALADAASLGHVLVAFDVDGAPRFDYPALAYDLDYYPSMPLRIAQRYLDVPWSKVALELGRGIALGPVYVPTDVQMRLMVNYLGPTRTFPTFSLAQVLSGEIPASTFANRIVLIGANALGTGDTFESPFTASLPGVERLATVIDSIIHEHHLRRPTAMLWIEIMVLLAAALAMAMAMSRLSLTAAALVGFSIAAAMSVSGQWALVRFGVWQASAVPIVASVLTFAALLFYRYGLLDRERRHMRHAFQRYLAPNMVDRLVSEQQLPRLGGEMRELTILFCDLRGFTTLTERLDPAVLTRLANEFFAVATDAVLEYGGTIDKYLGDAIMALWNAPLEMPDHAERACRAALRILERLGTLNAALAQEADMPILSAGVGINTGRCTVGNFGSSYRFDYSAIGDAVNVAARLEAETKEYGSAILIGAETVRKIPGFATLSLGQTTLRGRSTMTEIYALAGDENVRVTSAFESLLSSHAQLLAAILAGDREGALQLAAALARRAPVEFRPLYAAYIRRAQQAPAM
ncbi:MAG: adenylate/guanylate cyclase domain-containing protein [Casimicrobiaceae bacterium]